MFLLHIQAVGMELSVFLMKMGLHLVPDSLSPEKEEQDRGTCKPREPTHFRLIPGMSFSTSPCPGFPISLQNPLKAVEVFPYLPLAADAPRSGNSSRGERRLLTAQALKPDPEHFPLPAHPAMA